MTETLSVYSATADEALSLDFGVIRPGTGADLKFRIRNESDEYFAAGVAAVAADTSLYLSADGVTFTAQCEAGDISPQGTSSTLILRRVTPRAAVDGAVNANVSFTVTEWRPAVEVTTPT